MELKRIESNGLSLQIGPWDLLKSFAIPVRSIVFIDEQNVPEELELDELDKDCIHIVAFNDHEQPVATARLTPDGHIGRMAVLKEYRGKGVGAMVLNFISDAAKDAGYKKVCLAAQIHAIGFYENNGFELVENAEIFYDANIPHKMMCKLI